MQYQLLCKSEYLGEQNCADLLYESSDWEQSLEVAESIVKEICKLYSYCQSNLLPDELALGLDTGLYNFVLARGTAYYVDFYPPRHRIDDRGNRLDDTKIITHLPHPRNPKHQRDLVEYYYSRRGSLIHCLAHIWAALDSNAKLNEIWHKQQHLMLEKIFEILAQQHLDNSIQYLKTDLSLSNSQFQKLRQKLYHHRFRYIAKSTFGGYNLSDRQIEGHTIRKFYLADPKQGIGFSERAAYRLLKECRRYYQVLRQTGIEIPPTDFKILYLRSC